MYRYSIFLFLLAGLTCRDSNLDQSKQENEFPWTFRPNILWIVAEDLSPVIPAFGDSTIETSNLSRLAAEGIRYPRVFSPSGVCAPSRAALAMGMYPSRFGAQHMRTGFWPGGRPRPEQVKAQAPSFPEGLPQYEAMPPPEARMHSEYLRMQGYYCSNRFKQDYQFVAPVTAWDDCSRTAHWRNRKAGQPFFSIFNFEVTHESQIWTKANDSLWIDSTLNVPVPPYLPNTPVALRDVRRMYSNIREMDFQIGKVLRELEEDGLLDSTIIFWYGDHGGPLPRQKRLCYDSGLRAPLIIRYPQQWRAGQVDSQLVSFVDFLPTLMSLAEALPPAHLDGRAFAGKYATGPERAYIHGGGDRFDEKYDMIRAVRDRKYKYLRNFQPEKPYYLAVGYREQMPIMKELLRLKETKTLNEIQSQWFRSTKDPEELFDTEKDPHELNNLAALPEYTAKLAELRGECERWMRAIDDKGLIDEKEYIRSIWGGDHQPRTSDPLIDRTGNKVSISCKTEGASIGYKILSTSDTSKSWQVYIEPLALPAGNKLEVIAHRIGYLSSNVIAE